MTPSLSTPRTRTVLRLLAASGTSTQKSPCAETGKIWGLRYDGQKWGPPQKLGNSSNLLDNRLRSQSDAASLIRQLELGRISG